MEILARQGARRREARRALRALRLPHAARCARQQGGRAGAGSIAPAPAPRRGPKDGGRNFALLTAALEPGRRRHALRRDAQLRDDPRRGGARALGREARGRAARVLRHRDHQPRSDDGASSSAFRSRRRRARPRTCRSRTAMPARPTQLPRRRRSLARLQALARGSRRRSRSGRTSSTTATSSPTTASPCAASRTTRCCESYVLREPPAPRHGLARHALPRRDGPHPVRRRHRQGRLADSLRPGRHRARHRLLRRGCGRHAAAARRALSARRDGREAEARLLRTSRCRWRACSSRWSATAC